MEVFEVEGSREKRLVIGYKRGGTTKFFRYEVIARRFFPHPDRDPVPCPTSITSIHFIPRGNTSVSHSASTTVRPMPAHRPPEQFSNGITIISLYLNPLPNVNDAPPIENSIHQIMKEASLLYCLPDNPFFTPGNGHAVQEATYACRFTHTLSPETHRRRLSTPTDCGWIFAQHFCNRLGSSYLALRNLLDESNPDHAEVLNDIKRRFREETFTREYIEQILQAHPELVRELH